MGTGKWADLGTGISRKTIENGNRLKFDLGSHWDDGICSSPTGISSK
jgi:hypothetical protein